jgi:hypothetical protein
MKIGILTFHRAHNYGALLQAYALFKRRNMYIQFIQNKLGLNLRIILKNDSEFNLCN